MPKPARTVPLTLRVTRSLRAWLTTEARHEHRSVNGFIVRILTEHRDILDASRVVREAPEALTAAPEEITDGPSTTLATVTADDPTAPPAGAPAEAGEGPRRPGGVGRAYRAR